MLPEPKAQLISLCPLYKYFLYTRIDSEMIPEPKAKVMSRTDIAQVSRQERHLSERHKFMSGSNTVTLLELRAASAQSSKTPARQYYVASCNVWMASSVHMAYYANVLPSRKLTCMSLEQPAFFLYGLWAPLTLLVDPVARVYWKS